jgi:outer membrane receptor protein involved in Fe transport
MAERTRRRRSSLILGLVLPVLLGLAATEAAAQTGRIEGRVYDAESGDPLPYANVVIVGQRMGAMALDRGDFSVKGVPVGRYTVRAMMMGYKPEDKVDVVVNANQATRLEFRLERTIVAQVKEIVVEAEAPLVEVTSSEVSHSVSEEQLLEMPVDDVEEAIALKSGIVKTGDELHVRGGRSGEVQFQIDGIPVDDPLGGGRIDVGLLSTADSKIVTGGMDAEYGNAQSAVIEISTKEGGRHFEGQVRYMTDDFGRADKTYTNYDRLSIGFGGPTPWNNMKYYLSGEATFGDGEYLTLERREEHKILGDFLKYTDRFSTDYNLQSKLTWKPRRDVKVNLEGIYTYSKADQYYHNWNVDGYVRKVYNVYRISPTGGGAAEFFIDRNVWVAHGDWADDQRFPPFDLAVRDQDGNLLQTTRVKAIPAEKFIPPVRDDRVMAPLSIIPPGYADALGTNNFVLGLWDVRFDTPDGQTVYQPARLFEGFQNPFSTFSFFRQDDSYIYRNSAENTPETIRKNLQLKLDWTHNITPKTLYSLKVSRVGFDRTTAVRFTDPETGESRLKKPEEYLTAGNEPPGFPFRSSQDFYTDPDFPYFITAYDYPFYETQESITWVFRGDITSTQYNNHRFKTGLQVLYRDLNQDTRSRPGIIRYENGVPAQQGQNVNSFHNFNPEGALYVQDKWEYQGMVVNGGVRWDFLSPGNAAEITVNSSELDPIVDDWKTYISPRLGFAFPITDRDKFFFHYGRFVQFPAHQYLFQSQDQIGGASLLGNPNLDPELTISYQAGVAHQFSETIAGQFAVFNKDIYGLISSTRVLDDSTGIQSYRYINRTYASSRGLEVSLEKRLTKNFGGEIAYTYSFADGVASDAEFGVTAEGLSHLPTQELPLNWDQRHTLNLTVFLQDEGNWGSTFVYSYGSGLPWTPILRFERFQDPLLENSRRLPETHNLTVQGRKKFKVYGQELTLFFEGRNLLNDDILLPNGTAPGVFPGLENAAMDGGSYLTETGKFGGAYLKDIDDDGWDEFTPVHDPTIWATHRLWRMGFGFEF